jgi:photolyase PhrII
MSDGRVAPAVTISWDILPPHLRERLRVIESRESTPGTGGLNRPTWPAFVLYWMRTAVRVDENPALEVAQYLAAVGGLPLLVYHGLSDNYPYASDRHHRFMLEGARDVQAQMALRKISYVFHLMTAEDREPRLVQLAEAAAVVITEDMPVDPPRHFLDVLRRRVMTPIGVVDTACVVPMSLVPLTATGEPQTRAFQFRSVTTGLRNARLAEPWPALAIDAAPFPVEQLPFRSLDLGSVCLDHLIAGCGIDHSVPPVSGTEGGSTAGYRRWNEFVQNGLRSYAKRRNDPLIPSGVSRLSPYLHYGMVSPLRVAREAAAHQSSGSEKFLDELLIWRELSYHFCFQRRDHDQWSALPGWAQATLRSHSDDSRPQQYTWEQLVRGQTDDELWNAAQRCLLLNGELHNNLRMTWGKALLSWTRTPEMALRWLIDLNHRLALDGRDPSSYGGILWCLGQFDRPFEPAQPILGTVRPRPTRDHARRLDVARYRTQVESWQAWERPRVAVIGAGLAGLIAARTLTDHGCLTQCFEKSRGVAGRMSTRRSDDGLTFDHGAQYFTARHPVFQAHVDSWCQQGLAAIWPADQPVVVLRGGGVERVSDSVCRYVGVPGMAAIGREIARGLNVQLAAKVERVEMGPQRVSLWGSNGQCWGEFDRLIVAIPAPQAAELLGEIPELSQPLQRVPLQPCWATMVTFASSTPREWAGAFVQDRCLSWAAWNHTKPGRSRGTETLILHATPAWTIEAWEMEPADVGRQMLQAFWDASGCVPQPAAAIQSHRWRYALPAPVEGPATGSPDQYLRNSAGNVVVCGDWCAGGRVEGAFLSGMAAAGHVLRGRRSAAADPGGPVQMLLF